MLKKILNGIFFSIIPMGLLLLFTIIPFIYTCINSFYDMSYTTNNGFVGIDNYATILNSSEYLYSLKICLYYMLAAVIQVFIALLIAVILNNNKKFMNFFKNIIFFPYMINVIAIGFIFRLFFTRGYIFDNFLGILGFNVESLPYWLKDQSINNFVLASISIWRYTGFNVIIFLGALSSIDENLYDVARINKANKFQQFFYVSFPNIKKVFGLTLLLSVISSLNEFEIPFVVASGGSNKTATFMIYIYRTAFLSHKVGLASAMVIILMTSICLLLAITLLFYKIFNILSLKRRMNYAQTRFK